MSIFTFYYRAALGSTKDFTLNYAGSEVSFYVNTASFSNDFLRTPNLMVTIQPIKAKNISIVLLCDSITTTTTLLGVYAVWGYSSRITYNNGVVIPSYAFTSNEICEVRCDIGGGSVNGSVTSISVSGALTATPDPITTTGTIGLNGDIINETYPLSLPAFSAGQTPHYIQSTGLFSNVPGEMSKFLYQYVASTATPASGQFSIVDGAPNVIYFHKTMFDGRDNSFPLSFPYAYYLNLSTTDTSNVNKFVFFTSNFTLVGDVYEFNVENVQNSDFTSLDIVTLRIGQVNSLYYDSTNSNLSSKPNAVLTGNNNTAYGVEALPNSSSSYNVAVGVNALQNKTSGANPSTAVGYQALLNENGGNNVAVGTNAGANITTGQNNTFLGLNSGGNSSTNNSVAVGTNALNTVQVFNNCVAIGSGSMQNANINALNYNVAVGYQSLQNDTEGNNVAVGTGACVGNTSGSQNVAVGNTALAANMAGNANVAVGSLALTVTTDSNSTAVGSGALSLSTTGTNVAVGASSLAGLITGTSNTAVGSGAMDGVSSGSKNVAIGEETLRNNNLDDNIAIGFNASEALFDTTQSVAIGSHALQSAQSVIGNTAIGYFSQQLTTSGINCSVGANTLANNASGTGNTVVGTNAAQSLNTDNNTVVGHNALNANVSGNNNTVVGYNAYSASLVGINNVVIGASAVTTVGNRENNVVVGYAADSTFDNCVVLGANAASSATGQFCLGSGINPINTTGTATAGGAALPLTPDGFLEIIINGMAKKLAYYNP